MCMQPVACTYIDIANTMCKRRYAGLQGALAQHITLITHRERDMRNCCLSLLTVSSLAAIVASAPAAASTQLCPGAALAGVTGPITNGSSCNLEATGTTVSEVFVGVSAKDTDILNLGSTFIFNNQTATTTPPIIPAMQSVTKGDSLPYNLTNTTDPLSILVGGPPTFDTGTAYTNPAVSFPPLIDQSALPGVYHFAWFDIANATDFELAVWSQGHHTGRGRLLYHEQRGILGLDICRRRGFAGYCKRRLERHDLRIPGSCARRHGRVAALNSRTVDMGDDDRGLCGSWLGRLSRFAQRRGHSVDESR